MIRMLFLLLPPPSNPLSDSDERFLDDNHPPFDPSAPPLSLDSFRSEYRRMIEYICGLFPQAAGAPPVAPPPCALFESFFASSTPSQQSLSFNWFDRVCTALIDADARMASLIASGSSERLFLPPRHTFMLFAVSMPPVRLCRSTSPCWFTLTKHCARPC